MKNIENRYKYRIAYLSVSFFIAISFSIFSWLRVAGPSADFGEYYLLFVDKIGLLEPFWLTIRELINFDSGNLPILYGFVAFIALLLKVPILLKTKMATIAIPIYLFTFYFLHEYTQIRVALALGISYFILNISTLNYRKFIPVIYAIPSLFHYSLILLVFTPFLNRIQHISMMLATMLCYLVLFNDHYTLVLEQLQPKFGDNIPFNFFNILSTYFFLVHIIYLAYLRKSQTVSSRNYHNAAIIYAIAAIPFGVYQYGTAYFRLQEISASLFLPALFESIAHKRSVKKMFWIVFFGGYYLALSYKIFRDLI